MAIKKGSFVLLDYTGKVKETGEVFDTTSEEEAKKRGLRRPGGLFEPQLVVVGEGWVVKGLDEALLDMDVGKPTTVEVPPEKGLGQRDPSKMRLIPLRRFTARDVNPQPGMEVDVDGRPAVIRTVGAGRVQVDFNPPLAGRTLVYEATVKAVLETAEDKVKALIHRRIPSAPVEKFDIHLEGDALRITIPEEAFLTEGLQYAKRGIASDIERFLPQIQETTFIETFTRPKPSKEEAKPIEQVAVQPQAQAEAEATVATQPESVEASPATREEERPVAEAKRPRAGPRVSSAVV
ncbi:MAG: FKBP-type peptidyl-prolyl cis-trans isomerase [Candidatus Bathyarchaeia archaeon]